jgi:hypothetical protein
VERLRPDGYPKDSPVFGCSSIHDMVTSREAIIEEVNRWGNEEAVGLLKFLHHASKGGYIIFGGLDREYVRACIDIPGVTHDPSLDRIASQIALTDGTTEYPIQVGLPKPFVLPAINWRRRKSGLPELNTRILKENYWTADVTLSNVYGNFGSIYQLSDIQQIDIPEAESETASIPSRGLVFNPQAF